MRSRPSAAALALVLVLAVAPAAAHEDRAAAPRASAAAALAATQPGDEALPLRAAFDLVDHTGRAVSETDFRGRTLLVFFGYASCRGICPLALERMGTVVDLLGAEGARVQPLVITVDPARDTPAALAAKLPRIHPRLLGLTGSRAALAAARRAFGVRAETAAATAEGEPIYAHGGYLYVVGPRGAVLTVLPPVLKAEAMAAIVRGYLPRD